MAWTSSAAIAPSALSESAWSTRGFALIPDSEFRMSLAEKPSWISAEFKKSELGPVLRIIKAWRMAGRSIQEISALSGPEMDTWVQERDEDDFYPWKQSRSELNEDSLHKIWNSQDKMPVIRQIRQHAFLLEFTNSYVVIFPRTDQVTPPFRLAVTPTAVFETPWPFLPDILIGETLFGAPSGTPRPIIVWPSSAPRSLFVTPQFPSTFISSISSASQAWNSSVGFLLYGELGPNTQPSLWRCLIQETTCVHWEGQPDIPLSGMSASTQFIYDPISGKKFGSVIQFLNLRDRTSTEPRTLFSGTLPISGRDILKQTLSALMTTANPNGRLHPLPEKLITSFLIHEFGHDLGLKHDFAASTISDVTRPETPASVMDYLPWPMMHLVLRPGPLDIARVRTSMGLETPGVSLDDLSLHCSDPEVGKTTRCTGGDWGHPFSWLDTAAEIDPSLQTKLYQGGGLQVFRNDAVSIQDLIRRLLEEDPGEANLTSQMVKRLRSRIDQNQRPQ